MARVGLILTPGFADWEYSESIAQFRSMLAAEHG
jgi:hypothetical protein